MLESFQPKRNHLTLRRPPLEYLGVNSTAVSIARGNPGAVVGTGHVPVPILRDASLRDTPQDEVIAYCSDLNDSAFVGKTLG
jgi:hypothetical protein